jgi:hypothetical protein
MSSQTSSIFEAFEMYSRISRLLTTNMYTAVKLGLELNHSALNLETERAVATHVVA